MKDIEGDGSITIETPKVKVKTGPQIDQPFFIGYPDGKFHPTSNLTRAEAAAVISRIINLPDDANSKTAYIDVPSSHWAYSYIQKVSDAGYMVGFDGQFRRDEPITRAELVALVLRLRGVHAVNFESFDDLDKQKSFWT